MGMTMTQKILAAHAGVDCVSAGQLIEVNLDLVMGNDVTSPVAIHEMESKGFSCELVAEFSCVLTMSRRNPLAGRERVSLDDLSPCVEVAYADPSTPSLPHTELPKEDFNRRISVYERASLLSLLSANPQTFAWSSPASESLLARCELVQRPFDGPPRRCKDVLIYRKDYRLTDLDQSFLTELCAVRRETLPSGL